MKHLAILFFCWISLVSATAQVPHSKRYRSSRILEDSLRNIIKDLGLGGNFDAGEDGEETISLAVVDLSAKQPLLAGVQATNFIYPASVYKMYVAMEILKQVSAGQYQLSAPYIVPAHNAVDKTREISFDPRPLLRAGDTVTVNYLLDLMITRSDNSAANCLIDLASREKINTTIQENGWAGSEVTRKFLKRTMEDPGYDTIRSTQTNALHAADFLYKIQTGQLVNPWVSQQLKSLLGRQLDQAKLAAGLPRQVMFYHKTGWWSNYTHDVGIVDEGRTRYIIAVFLPLKEEQANPLLQALSTRVYHLMRNASQKWR
jgi:beta-lactamase class A